MELVSCHPGSGRTYYVTYVSDKKTHEDNSQVKLRHKLCVHDCDKTMFRHNVVENYDLRDKIPTDNAKGTFNLIQPIVSKHGRAFNKLTIKHALFIFLYSRDANNIK